MERTLDAVAKDSAPDGQVSAQMRAVRVKRMGIAFVITEYCKVETECADRYCLFFLEVYEIQLIQTTR